MVLMASSYCVAQELEDVYGVFDDSHSEADRNERERGAYTYAAIYLWRQQRCLKISYGTVNIKEGAWQFIRSRKSSGTARGFALKYI